jgi:hypothetical protein
MPDRNAPPSFAPPPNAQNYPILGKNENLITPQGRNPLMFRRVVLKEKPRPGGGLLREKYGLLQEIKAENELALVTQAMADSTGSKAKSPGLGSI